MRTRRAVGAASLSGKVNAFLLGILVLVAAAQWVLESALLSGILRDYSRASGDNLVELFAQLSVAPLRRLDYSQIRGNAQSLMRNADILSVTLRDRTGFNLTPFSTKPPPPGEATLTIKRDILDEIGMPLGTVEILLSLRKAQESIGRVLFSLFASFALMFALSWASMTLMLRILVIKPIRLVIESIDMIGRGDLAQKVPVRANDEIGLLASNFNAMAEKLKTSLETQVRSEKLAALGSLVSGVAHEINTPIGVCITAISLLGETSGEIRGQLERGDLSREALETYIGDVAQASDIIQKNLDQAARLVRSFKQISADQSSEQRRPIKLDAYLEEIVASLKPELRRAGVAVSIDCPKGIELDLHPGPLSQIVTILIMNARIHAFDGSREGHVSIRAREEGPRIVLRLSDDGRGMDGAELARIFDPFFTTRRGSGGTGLGLYILYNIVRDRFGGSVSVESEPGKGSAFTIVLPTESEAIKRVP